MFETETPDAQPPLPIGDVARLLGVSVETVRRWDRSGQIKSTRTPGGQRRFPVSEVNRLRAQSPATSEETYNVARAAEALDLSPRAVLHRINVGTLAAEKVGDTWVISRAEVERVLAQGGAA